MKYIFCVIFIFCLSVSVIGKSKHNDVRKMSGIVDSCHDGDTCRISVSGKIMKVRFSGIDAPEIKQPEGNESKSFLESLVLKKNVNLECEGRSFDRTTCIVFIGDKNINQEIVEAGFAWDSTKYSKGIYKVLMKKAQEQKRGIWRTVTISPYCYRHKKAKKCIGNPLWMD